MSRPDWDEWFMLLAQTVSLRGDCSRRQVGAVLVRPDNSLSSIGYNGVPRGEDGCLSGACPRAQSGVAPGSSYDSGPGTCIAQHAEQNCLANANESTVGFTMYLSTEACAGCIRTMKAHRLIRAAWPGGEVAL